MEYIGEDIKWSFEVAIDKLDERLLLIEKNVNILLEGCEHILKTVDILLQGEILKSDPSYKIWNEMDKKDD